MGQVTGGYLAAKALQAEGVDTVFYLLSAPIVGDCLRLGMKGILVRNETAAGMIAHGYSRVTGKPGIVLSAHGPGTANVVPSMANALADACPVINFGASASLVDREAGVFPLIGAESFHERTQRPGHLDGFCDVAADVCVPHAVAQRVG